LQRNPANDAGYKQKSKKPPGNKQLANLRKAVRVDQTRTFFIPCLYLQVRCTSAEEYEDRCTGKMVHWSPYTGEMMLWLYVCWYLLLWDTFRVLSQLCISFHQ